ncbi:MAG: beta-galactosidase [Planctomycetota bacterium]
MRIPILWTCLLASLWSSCRLAPEPLHRFEIGEKDFLLDGKPFRIRSGEMHAARIPPDYWRHRLRMVKAMGCNAVCAYLFWNQHEPEPERFVFTGAADVARYCRIALDEGLFVILRPGPYSCAEWEFGGFPWWLLRGEGVTLRSRDPRYLAAVRRYLLEVGKELAPLQVTRGGPILMVQVENEYGSYGKDKDYIGAVRDILREAGFEVPLFTCDGPSQLPNDTRDDLFSVVNFGGDPEGAFAALRKVRPRGPLMCGEYYPGWFDSWGKPHHRGDTKSILKDLGWMLDRGASFSIYMAHGGTSFGFTAGANSPPFSPQVTSYDYDAPIDEAGRPTPKFRAIRELFARHLQPGEALPDVPPPPLPVVSVPPAEFRAFASLRGSQVPWAAADRPLSFEELAHPSGIVRYRHHVLEAQGPGSLRVAGVHDYAQVFVDGKRVGVLDRRHGQDTIDGVRLPAKSDLEILVEAFGRVNYGRDLHDRKGILGDVTLDGQPLRGWRMQSWRLDPEFLKDIVFDPLDSASGGPGIYKGVLRPTRIGDTWLDMSSWNRGAVWVNGHPLGRYWDLGPQQILYLPGCWLHDGENEILVLDASGDARDRVVRGVEAPILDAVGHDPAAPPPHRRPGQHLSLEGLAPIGSGVFPAGAARHEVRFDPVPARFLCLEALGSWPADPFTTCAEFGALDAAGAAIDRTGWKVAYADSEELAAENGSADLALDGRPETFWHTEWQAEKPPHPHRLVVDLGAIREVGGIAVLPRQDSDHGRISGYLVYASPKPFPGLSQD